MDELQTIQSKIYEIRGQRVILDRDLAIPTWGHKLWLQDLLTIGGILVVDKAFACHFLGLLQSHDVENGRSHVG